MARKKKYTKVKIQKKNNTKVNKKKTKVKNKIGSKTKRKPKIGALEEKSKKTTSTLEQIRRGKLNQIREARAKQKEEKYIAVSEALKKLDLYLDQQGKSPSGYVLSEGSNNNSNSQEGPRIPYWQTTEHQEIKKKMKLKSHNKKKKILLIMR